MDNSVGVPLIVMEITVGASMVRISGLPSALDDWPIVVVKGTIVETSVGVPLIVVERTVGTRSVSDPDLLSPLPP